MEIIFHKKGPLALSRCGLSAAVECTKGESRIARLKVLCVDKPFARDLFRGRIGILPPYLADDDVAAGTLVRLGRRACYRHPKTANKRCNRNRLALTPLPENPRPTSRRGSQLGLLCNATDIRGGNGRAAAVPLGSAANTQESARRFGLQFVVLAEFVRARD